MAVRLYMDVHVPEAITVQLRRRQIDVLTAIEDGSAELADDELLASSAKSPTPYLTTKKRLTQIGVG